MSLSALRAPSTPSSLYPSSSTSISNAALSISAAFSYFPSVSTVSRSYPTSSYLSSFTPGLLTSYLLRICLSLSSICCPTACCTFYAGLKGCAQLQIATHRLFLVPIYPHYKFSQGLAERPPYSHRLKPWPFIKRHQAICH